MVGLLFFLPSKHLRIINFFFFHYRFTILCILVNSTRQMRVFEILKVFSFHSLALISFLHTRTHKRVEIFFFYSPVIYANFSSTKYTHTRTQTDDDYCILFVLNWISSFNSFRSSSSSVVKYSHTHPHTRTLIIHCSSGKHEKVFFPVLNLLSNNNIITHTHTNI